jgi:hypothetical protein
MANSESAGWSDPWADIQAAVERVERQAREPQSAPRFYLPGGGELLATDLPFLYAPDPPDRPKPITLAELEDRMREALIDDPPLANED